MQSSAYLAQTSMTNLGTFLQVLVGLSTALTDSPLEVGKIDQETCDETVAPCCRDYRVLARAECSAGGSVPFASDYYCHTVRRRRRADGHTCTTAWRARASIAGS